MPDRLSTSGLVANSLSRRSLLGVAGGVALAGLAGCTGTTTPAAPSVGTGSAATGG